MKKKKKNVVAVNIKRRREHGNLLRSRVIFNIRSDQIGSDSSFDRSSSLDEIWALAAMKFEERFTSEVFRYNFEIRFHHDSSGTLWYKCLCLGSTCMYYLDLHSIRKTHARHKRTHRKTTMEGPGSIRSKTMVVAVDGPHGVRWGGCGLGMSGNLLY